MLVLSDPGESDDDSGEFPALEPDMEPGQDDDFEPDPEPFTPSEDDLADIAEWSAEIDRRWRDEQIERGEPEFPGILPPDPSGTLAYQDCR